MARMNGNTDSGIESDPECEPTVLLVVDIGIEKHIEINQNSNQIHSKGSQIMSSREDNNGCEEVVNDDNSSGRQEVVSDVVVVAVEEEKEEVLPMEALEGVGVGVPMVLPQPEPPLESVEEKDPLLMSFQLILTSGEVLTIGLDAFSEYEAQSLSEFFDGSQRGKTSKSYIEIRNHFIKHWTQIRPKRFGYHEMLRKVGHLHLGNVTAFSRVQKFLEAHKAINEFGKNHVIRPKVTSLKKKKKNKNSFKDNNEMKKLLSTSTPPTPPLPTPNRPSQPRTRPNPFKLVPLEAYDTEADAPFAIRLSMEALAIIDIHAHCVRTEVIGLLGGVYNPKTKELFILTAEPCASLDDHDLQCDMEPVSQALAKERLEQKSYHVVGWYHSHPTFVPNPSLRDLETQNVLQQYFSKDSSQPFVALILSPYLCGEDRDRQTALVSKFKCLWLSEQMNAQNDYKIPYELSPQIIRREKLMFSVENKLIDLCLKIKGHASKVAIRDRIKRFRGVDINHLDKLCHSLRHYLSATGMSVVECDYMLDKLRDILINTLDGVATVAPPETGGTGSQHL